MSTEAHSFMSPKAQFFNASKSHRMLRFSRIYTDKRTNLGIIVRRKYFQASWLLKMVKYPPRVLSNFKEERVKEIGWTST